ncbi:hypothetical protein EDB19DRAFT_1916315 [Suillus lakei]|nr:hypothetical protein EDB19DRAFT_1916315 [Suillus lakei]
MSDPHELFLAGTKKPSIVNTITYMGASPELSLVKFDCFGPSKVIQDKCNVWLHALLHLPDIMQVDSKASGTLGSPKALEVLLRPNDQFLCLPHSLKTWVDNIMYHAYMSATFAEAKPLYINNNDSFKAKEQKTLEVLKSDIHIPGPKKQHAQSKVDMLSKAISHISEFGDDVTSSGSTVTYASLSIDDYVEDRFDDWVLTSYASSNIELL